MLLMSVSPRRSPRAPRSGHGPAAPPGASPSEKLRRMITNAGHMNQYDIMFSFGNAMSGAPIMSGIVKLPNAPASTGMMTRKIITVACIVNIML